MVRAHRLNYIHSSLGCGAVRYVIHQSLSKSITGYYQESGRAGRDGFEAQCYIFFSYKDKSKLQNMIMKSRDETGGAAFVAKDVSSITVGMENLLSSVSFCLNDVDCRRHLLLDYFGEKFPAEQCHGTCDNCRHSGSVTMVDFTEHAKCILAIVKEVEKNRRQLARLTLLKLVKLYSGAKDKELSKYSAAVPAIGDFVRRGALIGKLNKNHIERLLMEMVIKKYLDEEIEENTMGFSSGEWNNLFFSKRQC
jgi:bloom syndrome protein